MPVLVAKYKEIADCKPVRKAFANINFQYAFQSFLLFVNLYPFNTIVILKLTQLI